jgi:hypothetical protein
MDAKHLEDGSMPGSWRERRAAHSMHKAFGRKNPERERILGKNWCNWQCSTNILE